MACQHHQIGDHSTGGSGVPRRLVDQKGPAQPVAGPDVRAVHERVIRLYVRAPLGRADLAHRRRLDTGEGLALFAGAVRVPQSRPGSAQRGRGVGPGGVSEITTAAVPGAGGDRNRLIGKRMARRRPRGIGAFSSAVVTVPSAVVEDEPMEIAGSEMARARHESYGDRDAGGAGECHHRADTGVGPAACATITD